MRWLWETIFANANGEGLGACGQVESVRGEGCLAERGRDMAS